MSRATALAPGRWLRTGGRIPVQGPELRRSGSWWVTSPTEAGSREETGASGNVLAPCIGAPAREARSRRQVWQTVDNKEIAAAIEEAPGLLKPDAQAGGPQGVAVEFRQAILPTKHYSKDTADRPVRQGKDFTILGPCRSSIVSAGTSSFRDASTEELPKRLHMGQVHWSHACRSCVHLLLRGELPWIDLDGYTSSV